VAYNLLLASQFHVEARGLLVQTLCHLAVLATRDWKRYGYVHEQKKMENEDCSNWCPWNGTTLRQLFMFSNEEQIVQGANCPRAKLETWRKSHTGFFCPF